MRFKPPKFLRRLAPELVWELPARAQDSVYLTFDDGPTPEITEWILSELERRDARATFFCLGRNAAAHPELVRKIIEAGHRIGNHTWGHARGWSTDVERYVEDVDRAAAYLGGDIEGGAVKLFRPPYGQIMPVQARALAGRFRIVMWNVISRDYNRAISPRTCLENVTRHVQPGDIIVFHDSAKAFRNMSYALPRVLDYLAERELNSKTIDL